jgi:hypothetical protein
MITIIITKTMMKIIEKHNENVHIKGDNNQILKQNCTLTTVWQTFANIFRFLNTEKHFSDNSYLDEFSNVVSTTNPLFKTKHIIFFRKQKKNIF